VYLRRFQVVKDAFPSFTDEERERLHRMLTNVRLPVLILSMFYSNNM
jgi:hypothetical protein